MYIDEDEEINTRREVYIRPMEGDEMNKINLPRKKMQRDTRPHMS